MNSKVKNMSTCCMATKKGISIANCCLERKIPIDTKKLNKLLVLIHFYMINNYNHALFKGKIIKSKVDGIIVTKVNRELASYKNGFKHKLPEQISLTHEELTATNMVLNEYGYLSIYELDELL